MEHGANGKIKQINMVFDSHYLLHMKMEKKS